MVPAQKAPRAGDDRRAGSAGSFTPSSHMRRNRVGEVPTLSVNRFVKEPRLLYPTASDISVTLSEVDTSKRLAWYMRTAERNLLGETPVAPLKTREK